MFEGSSRRLPAAALLGYAHALLVAAGLPEDRAQDVAEILLEGDLLGHSTHGLALLPRYLQEIRGGRMTIAGDPRVVADHGDIWNQNLLDLFESLLIKSSAVVPAPRSISVQRRQ